MLKAHLIIHSILFPISSFLADFCSSPTTDFDGLGEPVGAFIIRPLTLLLRAVFCGIPHTDAMFHVVLPLADVLVAVREDHRAIAVLLTHLEVTLVHTAIFIRESTLALEQVVRERAFISALRFGKIVDTLTGEYAIDEVTFVEAAVGPLVATASVLLALIVGTLESDASLIPGFAPKTVLLIIQPFAIVGGAF